MDELRKIDEFTYEILANLLFSMVPEYKTNFDSFGDENYQVGNYLFMNNFASYLGEEIKKDTSSNFVINSFMFINKIGESDNLEVLNILKVGILEILYTTPMLDRNGINNFLSDKLQKYFQDFSRFYY